MIPSRFSTQQDEVQTARFLLTCSHTSLGDFVMAKMDLDRDLEKQINQLVRQRVENLSWLRIAELFRRHPELRLPQPAAHVRTSGLHSAEPAASAVPVRAERDGSSTASPADYRDPRAVGGSHERTQERSAQAEPGGKPAVRSSD